MISNLGPVSPTSFVLLMRSKISIEIKLLSYISSSIISIHYFYLHIYVFISQLINYYKYIYINTITTRATTSILYHMNNVILSYFSIIYHLYIYIYGCSSYPALMLRLASFNNPHYIISFITNECMSRARTRSENTSFTPSHIFVC